MRFTVGLALVAALGAAACKKNSTANVSTTGSGSDTGSALAVGSAGSGGSESGGATRAALPAVDAAAGPWQMPAGVTAGSADADATGLGTAVAAHVLERIIKPTPTDKVRLVKTLLVLEGGGKALVADVTAGMTAEDGSPPAMAIKTESDIVQPALTPPRTFQSSDNSDYPLDFKGPLMFLVHLKSKNEARFIAVAQDQDSLAVWTLVIPTDSVDVAPEWEKTGTIKLAPGATVSAAGSGS